MSHPDIKIYSPITREDLGYLWWNGGEVDRHSAFAVGYCFVATSDLNALSPQTLRFILDQIQVANKNTR
jgi:hypothetical protein